MKKRGSIFFSAILILGLIIAMHEAAHFIVAILLDLPVKSYNLGFGPSVYSLFIGDHQYNLNIIMLGGYVEMDQSYKYLEVNPWKALMLSSAGIVVNLASAFIVLKKKVITELLSDFYKLDFNLGRIKSRVDFFGKMSLALGIFNMIPFGILDGGKIVSIILNQTVDSMYIVERYQIMTMIPLVIIFAYANTPIKIRYKMILNIKYAIFKMMSENKSEYVEMLKDKRLEVIRYHHDEREDSQYFYEKLSILLLMGDKLLSELRSELADELEDQKTMADYLKKVYFDFQYLDTDALKTFLKSRDLMASKKLPIYVLENWVEETKELIEKRDI